MSQAPSYNPQSNPPNDNQEKDAAQSQANLQASTLDEKQLLAYDLAIDEQSYAVIERDFHEIISELIGDTSMDDFRSHYEKLHASLKKTHENEKVLVQRVRELAQQLSQNQIKMKHALRMSREDQQTISSLKAEVDKAYDAIKQNREKEGESQQEIASLYLQVQNLRQMVDTANGGYLGIPEEQSIEDLQRAREVLNQQLLEAHKSLRNYAEELRLSQEKIYYFQEEKLAQEVRIRNMKDQLGQARLEMQNHEKQKTAVETSLQDLRIRCDRLEKETSAKNTEIDALKMEISRTQDQFKSAQDYLAQQYKDEQSLSDKLTKARSEQNELLRQITALKSGNKEKDTQISQYVTQYSQQRQQQNNLNRQLQSLQQRIESLEIQKQAYIEKNEALRQGAQELAQQLAALQQANNSTQKDADTLRREQQVVSKQLQVAEVTVADKQDLLLQQNAQNRIFESEIAAFRGEAQKQRNVIFTLEKEREQYSHQATEMHQKFQQAMQELKMRELSIYDLQKRVTDTDSKLRYKQALYEQVRADRNLYSKNLVEAQDEIAELKRYFRVMSHVIDQLKQEIQAKDSSLVKEHFELNSLVKQKENIVQDLERVRQNVRESELEVNRQKQEIAKLNHIIAEADIEHGRQLKEYKVVISERDILGTYLIRRNDELSLLYEKVRIHQATLAKGEKQYGYRVDEIRLLRAKVTDLRRYIVYLRRQAASIDPYRKELYRLYTELLDEQAKTRALTYELYSPMNVHRWRYLEGSDPYQMELIKRVRHLQKRLIEKTEEVGSKYQEIEEKERLYNALKKALNRYPGPETLYKLNHFYDYLKYKTNYLKSVSAELVMFYAYSNEYRNEIEYLTKELQEIKRKYFIYKRKEFNEISRRAEQYWEDNNGFIAPNEAAGSGNRFVGGGFSVSHTGQNLNGGVAEAEEQNYEDPGEYFRGANNDDALGYQYQQSENAGMYDGEQLAEQLNEYEGQQEYGGKEDKEYGYLNNDNV